MPIGPLLSALVADVSREGEKRAAAETAVELVEDGMRVGLGTGSIAAYVLPALAGAACGGCAASRHRRQAAVRTGAQTSPTAG